MRDLLDRELKNGDMCIGMAIGRNSSGMHLGIFQGSSVVYLSHDETYINKSCTSTINESGKLIKACYPKLP